MESITYRLLPRREDKPAYQTLLLNGEKQIRSIKLEK